jgi:acetophenone carboxylase
MSRKVKITESLDIDVERLIWCCNRCGADLISASESYKKGCLVRARDPREVHNPIVDGEYGWSPDHAVMRIVEFYCPACQIMFENEYLPLGHPITRDIELDLKALQKKYLKEGE